MLLIEGPDRCGKSTVAQEVLKLMPRWSYRHHTKPPVDSFTYFSWFLADARPRVVVDRLHWSDYAYGNTYDGGMKLTPHEWRMIELSLAALGTTVLLLTDEPEAVRGRWAPDEMYDSGPITQLVDRYDELVDQTSYPVISRLPVRSARLPELIHDGKPTVKLLQIVATVEQDAGRCAGLMAPSIGYGNPNAEFMVLGEAPGAGRFKGKSMRPQMPFSSGPASEWLWRALDDLKLSWWQGYYTNASAFAGPSDFGEYVARNLSTVKTVLCLGTRARDLVESATYTVDDWPSGSPLTHTVDHPAYARRFRHGEFLEWQAEIYRALCYWCGR